MPQAMIDKLFSQHTAILGKTGSGKSYAAKGIVEQMLEEKRQVCILDPTAAWWGMRLSADGKSRGYDVILLGGTHADIPLAERSGAAVARLVTEQFANVVIDTSGMTVGEYTRWFIDFAGTLYTTIREPLHLIIDEAHYFMPQGKVMSPDAGKMLHAGNRLMSGGRSRGIRGMMITQRPAKLHKDALTCADTLIAMRVIAPQDRGAIKEWIDGAGDPAQGKAVLDSLAQLQRGEGWIWYPEGGVLERRKFPRIRTYDSSASPKHGAKSKVEVGSIDLKEVQAAMAEAVKEAEANDPKKLRAKIADLERQLSKLAKTQQVPIDKGALDRAYEQGRSDVMRDVNSFWAFAERHKDKLAGDLKNFTDALQRNWEILNKKHSSTVSPAAERRTLTDKTGTLASSGPTGAMQGNRALPSQARQTLRARKPAGSGTIAKTITNYARNDAGALGKRAQNFLDAAATLTTLGTEVTRETVSAWVGVHPRGGSVGDRGKEVCRLVGRPMYCLALNANKSPKHPLYVRRDIERKPYWTPKE